MPAEHASQRGKMAKTLAALTLSAAIGGVYKFQSDAINSPATSYESFPRCLSKHQLRGGKLLEGETKSSNCGEDSFMVSKRGNTFAVADGVGGWVKHGVNPKHFSEQLVQELQKTADESKAEPLDDLLGAVTGAYATVKTKVKSGSSTLCLATAGNDGKLATYNIGDSGLLVVRSGAVVFQTTETSHSFNFPKQLGVHRGKQAGDNPSDGVIEQFGLLRGDTILIVSDGVLDNVSPSALAAATATTKCGDEVAKKILQQTAKFALDGDSREKTWEKGGFGKKPDDITVLVVCAK